MTNEKPLLCFRRIGRLSGKISDMKWRQKCSSLSEVSACILLFQEKGEEIQNRAVKRIQSFRNDGLTGSFVSEGKGPEV